MPQYLDKHAGRHNCVHVEKAGPVLWLGTIQSSTLTSIQVQAELSVILCYRNILLDDWPRNASDHRCCTKLDQDLREGRSGVAPGVLGLGKLLAGFRACCPTVRALCNNR